MNKLVIFIVFLLLIFSFPVAAYQSLQEIYDLAEGSGEYDKYIELDSDVEYLGDLNIPYGHNVRLDGGGALIHGIYNNIAILVWGSNLDISNCVIAGGSYGIRFDTLASGTIHSNTITLSDYAGIAVLHQNQQDNVEVWDNIITDCYYGFLCILNLRPEYLGHNTIYNTFTYRYAELDPE